LRKIGIVFKPEGFQILLNAEVSDPDVSGQATTDADRNYKKLAT